jgi:hypothetical protein
MGIKCVRQNAAREWAQLDVGLEKGKWNQTEWDF